MNKSRFVRGVVFALLLSMVLLEAGAHVVALFDSKRAPSFRLDRSLGWIKIARPESEIVTAKKNMFKTLILGDSFVFGADVALEERFDQQMIQNGYTDRIVNRGVSGYSTDQELMSATQDLDDLKTGDTVVLVTFGDDFRGLISSFFAGRPKPRYHLVGGDLQLTPPSIGWMDRLRDRFYLVRVTKRLTTPRSATDLNLGEAKLREAKEIYRALLQKYLVPVAKRGVNVVIVFHGKDIVDKDFGQGFGQRVADDLRPITQSYGFTFLDRLDELEFKRYRQSNSVHWNPEGHRRFAEWLTTACDKSNNQLHLSHKESS